MPRTIDFTWKHGPLTSLARGGYEVAGRTLEAGMPLRLAGALGSVMRTAGGVWVWRREGHADDGCLLSSRLGEVCSIPAA